MPRERHDTGNLEIHSLTISFWDRLNIEWQEDLVNFQHHLDLFRKLEIFDQDPGDLSSKLDVAIDEEHAHTESQYQSRLAYTSLHLSINKFHMWQRALYTAHQVRIALIDK
jgi:hypothetical protein